MMPDICDATRTTALYCDVSDDITSECGGVSLVETGFYLEHTMADIAPWSGLDRSSISIRATPEIVEMHGAGTNGTE